MSRASKEARTLSHGNGKRMTVEEAVRRRERMIRFHGSLQVAFEREYDRRAAVRLRHQRRDWNDWECFFCPSAAQAPGDVGLDDSGAVVALCSECRSSRNEPRRIA